MLFEGNDEVHCPFTSGKTSFIVFTSSARVSSRNTGLPGVGPEQVRVKFGLPVGVEPPPPEVPAVPVPLEEPAEPLVPAVPLPFAEPAQPARERESDRAAVNPQAVVVSRFTPAPR